MSTNVFESRSEDAQMELTLSSSGTTKVLRTREEFNVASFAGCAICTTCVPGAGPVDADEDAPRGDDAHMLQRAFFDGHHRVHDIKMLTTHGPNGMTLATHGPTSG